MQLTPKKELPAELGKNVSNVPWIIFIPLALTIFFLLKHYLFSVNDLCFTCDGSGKAVYIPS